MPLHSISYSDSKKYITSFLQNLTEPASLCLGGTFLKSAFDITVSGQSEPGIIGWYCFNYDNIYTGLPHLFIAVEGNNVEYGSSPPEECFNTGLHYAQTFPYTGEWDEDGLAEFIENQEAIPETNYSISKSVTEDLKLNFLEKFPEGQANNFAVSSCAFFKADEINSFLRQNDGSYSYVRYFFGLDDGLDQKVRLIFFPVDNNGKNVISGVTMQQHSWPPSP